MWWKVEVRQFYNQVTNEMFPEGLSENTADYTHAFSYTFTKIILLFCTFLELHQKYINI